MKIIPDSFQTHYNVITININLSLNIHWYKFCHSYFLATEVLLVIVIKHQFCFHSYTVVSVVGCCRYDFHYCIYFY